MLIVQLFKGCYTGDHISYLNLCNISYTVFIGIHLLLIWKQQLACKVMEVCNQHDAVCGTSGTALALCRGLHSSMQCSCECRSVITVQTQSGFFWVHFGFVLIWISCRIGSVPCDHERLRGLRSEAPSTPVGGLSALRDGCNLVRFGSPEPGLNQRFCVASLIFLLRQCWVTDQHQSGQNWKPMWTSERNLL